MVQGLRHDLHVSESYVIPSTALQWPLNIASSKPGDPQAQSGMIQGPEGSKYLCILRPLNKLSVLSIKVFMSDPYNL